MKNMAQSKIFCVSCGCVERGALPLSSTLVHPLRQHSSDMHCLQEDKRIVFMQLYHAIILSMDRDRREIKREVTEIRDLKSF